MQNHRQCRVMEARRIARRHYEAGNQMCSYKQVWRRYIVPKMGISYRTFLNYLKDDLPWD